MTALHVLEGDQVIRSARNDLEILDRSGPRQIAGGFYGISQTSSGTVSRKRGAAGTLTSLLKIGPDHLPVAEAGDKDAPWNLFAL